MIKLMTGADYGAEICTTGDEANVILQVRAADGAEHSFKIEAAQLAHLAALSARALAEMQRRRHAVGGPRARIDVTWWNLEQDADLKLFALETCNGGSLAFDLSPSTAAALLAILDVYLGRGSNGPAEPGFVA